MKTVLVTGATGFLGHRTVVYLLNNTNFNIVAAARTRRTERMMMHERLTYFFGDLEDEIYVDRLFSKSPSALVNCASLSAPWGPEAAFISANVHTQSLLIDRAQKHRLKRFIYISSPSIYVNFQDRENITEQSPLGDPVNHYAATKRAAEQLLKDSSLPYIILRPRALIGKGDTIIFPRLLTAHRQNKLKKMGHLQNKVHLTAVANAAHAIYLALLAPSESLREDYNITNDESVLLWPTIQHVFDQLQLPPIKGTIPTKFAYFLAHTLELVARFTQSKKEPALTRYSVSTLTATMTFDLTKAREKLGYQPIMTTEEALQEFIQHHKNQV